MSLVFGKVLLKETKVGIPDLLVEIHDVNPGPSTGESALGGSNPAGILEALAGTGGSATGWVPG
jgi:hypothetical protein